MDKTTIIKIVCAECGYRWPKELGSGVMFYDGHRITIAEFNAWAVNFR